jgi:hypothetical protein
VQAEVERRIAAGEILSAADVKRITATDEDRGEKAVCRVRVARQGALSHWGGGGEIADERRALWPCRPLPVPRCSSPRTRSRASCGPTSRPAGLLGCLQICRSQSLSRKRRAWSRHAPTLSAVHVIVLSARPAESAAGLLTDLGLLGLIELL